VISGHPRRNSIGGVLLAVVGGLILVAGLIAAVYSAFAWPFSPY